MESFFTKIDITSLSLAFFGGILPALIWLLFWLQEDSKNPEPKKLIFLSFLFGMLSVPVVFYLQWFTSSSLIGNAGLSDLFFTHYTYAIIVIILWSAFEEIAKYIAALFSGLRKKAFDEPIDAMIYMITAALGFAAAENALFIFSPLIIGEFSTAFITGNLRFISSTLLHVAASAIVGACLAFSYYKNSNEKYKYLLVGLVGATALHTVFNSFIIRSEKFTLIGFSLVWLSVIGIILAFEKVKRIKKIKNNK